MPSYPVIPNDKMTAMSRSDFQFIIDCEKDIRRTIHECNNTENYGQEVCYSEAIADYISKSVVKADRKNMTKCTALSYLQERTGYQKHFTLEYRTVINGIQTFCEMSFVALTENKILQSVTERNDTIINKLIFDRLEKSYLTLIAVDLDSGLFHVLKDSPWHDGLLTEKVMEYEPAASAFANIFDGAAKDYLLKHSKLDFVKQRYAAEDESSFTFKSPFKNFEGWLNVTGRLISRHEDGTPSLLAIYFNKADTDAAKTAELQKRLRDNLQIVGGLAKEYDVLHIINLDEDEFLPYVQSKGIDSDILEISSPGISWSLAHVMSVKPLVHPDYIEEMLRYADKEYIRSKLENKRRHSIHILIKKELNGEKYFWCEYVLIKLDDIDKRATRIAMGYVDIDEQVLKELEQQKNLEEALAMAKSANQAKTAFLNNMSHDIRTPMNAIIGFTSLAASHIDDKEKIQEYLGKIKQSSEHLLSLINEVLDMSKIESGVTSINEKEEDLTSIITGICDVAGISIQKKQLEFAVDTKEIFDDLIVCDKLHLNKVLINVLSNAVKYTPANGKISLCVKEERLDPDYGKFTFIIKDTGIGMSEEFLKNIFKPFSRAKSSTVSGIQGTGLGMAITKNIIDMMNGEIGIKSKEGEGTEVSIAFAFKLVKKETVIPESTQSPEEIDLSGKKILVVEDNMLNMEIITAILSEFGCEVATAGDGGIAVEIMSNAAAGEYDLVLMDIQMPIMNGIEATKLIRKLDTANSRIPIIAMTANAFEEDRIAVLEAGMNEHIIKPFNIDHLRKTLFKFLR